MASFFSKLLAVVVLFWLSIPSIAQTSPQTIVGLTNAQQFEGKQNGTFYIQLGIFSKKKNAYRLENDIRDKTKYPIHVKQKHGRYIVSLGPMTSGAEVSAEGHNLASYSQISRSLKIQPLLIRLHSSVKKYQTIIHRQSWSVTASLGYTDYQNMYLNTGQTVIGRLAFGKEFFTKGPFSFGMELGAQNGNSMQLAASEEALRVLGGLPIQTTVKPIFDVLATLNTAPIGKSTLFGQLKGGVAYRRWQFEDRNSINNLSQLAGEIQAGLGLPLSEKTRLSLLYQGIFGGNPQFNVNTITETGHVGSIPIQQGLLLSLSLTV